MTQSKMSIILWVSFLLCYYQGYGNCATVKPGHFNLNPSCYEETIKPQTRPCWTNLGKLRSGVACATRCVETNGCFGFSINSANECNLHNKCQDLSFMCTIKDKTKYVFYERSRQPLSCHNAGIWNSVEARCDCHSGWVGDKCERLARTCVELMTYYYSAGLKNVPLHPNTSSKPFMAQCRLTYKSGSKDHVQTTVAVANFLDFNKTWSDYENGLYGEDTWLGLKNLYHILQATNPQTDLFIQLALKNNTLDDPSVFSMIYSNFKLSDATSGYAFTFSAYTADAPGADSFYAKENLTVQDCLTPLVGAKFSTYDQDNDESTSENCALMAGNGWWFKSCNEECNILGKLYDSAGPFEAPYSYNRIRIGGVDMHRYAGNVDYAVIFLHNNVAL